MRRIFWAGDSTVKANKYDTFPQTGMGQAMPVYLENDVVILNHGENGRSTKSFIEEGRLAAIEKEIGAGDYLFIQFGHNDEKKEDPARFTESHGTYQENLKKMVDMARSHGAYPVLITPLYRRQFNEEGKLREGSHLDYPEAMKELAEREQVPCIDLCRASYEVIQKEGEEKSRRWFMYFEENRYPAYADGMKDNTHLRYEGAERFAGLVAEGLNALGGHYRSLLVPSFRKTEDAVRRITVAQDGSGDYTTVKEAAASVSADNRQPVTIFIRKGVYKERLEITAPFLTLEGEDAEETVITYDRYAKMEMEDGMKRGTFRSYSVFVNTHDFTARNLTFENSSGLGTQVGQALALYVDGDRIVFDGCRLLGHQDTLFTGPLPPKEIEKNGFIGPKQYAPRINGRHYYKNCFICGEVDFIFGSATCYFEDCELFSKNVGKEVNGYVTAASTPEGQEYGYVFHHCRFTSDCPKESVYLGRPWRNFAKTVILNSEIGPHICREGWHDWGKTDAQKTVFFAEYGNYGEGAALAGRPDWVVRLKEEELEHFRRDAVLAGADGWLTEK